MRLRKLLLASALGLVAAPASADSICEWMEFAQRLPPQGPPPAKGPPNRSWSELDLLTGP